jgi:hypothetical protein
LSPDRAEHEKRARVTGVSAQNVDAQGLGLGPIPALQRRRRRLDGYPHRQSRGSVFTHRHTPITANTSMMCTAITGGQPAR